MTAKMKVIATLIIQQKWKHGMTDVFYVNTDNTVISEYDFDSGIFKCKYADGEYREAFSFFSDVGCDLLEMIDLDMIEGRHPGDDTQVAELTGSIEAANAAAEKLGLDFRFEPAPT
jgi:hypothetical protein